MGIEDIQISEELETNAPSIKYRGDEGPKSPQQEKMMMLIQKLMSQGMGQEEAMQVAQQMMAQAEQQQMAPQGMPPRQMAAFGGIMGVDGRRKYGFGSKFKKFVRNIIPNEVAEVAVKAAPFVAPFNPIAAGLMSGIGGFDQTGKIGSSIKSGLMNYGMGQVARGIGGGTGNLQGASLKTMPGKTGFGSYFSSPVQSTGGIGKMFADKFSTSGGSMATGGPQYELSGMAKGGGEILKKPGFVESIGNKISSLLPTTTMGQLALGGGAVALGTALLGGGPEETIDEIMNRGEGLDLVDIRTRVTEAYKDSSGEKLRALRVEFPFLGTAASKNTAIMADGGRIGYAMGGYTTGGTGFNKPGYLGGMATRMPMEEGGIMDLGGMEKDYRAEGGFVPIGKKEKADDVPARLSVNEFVFTADAVRNAGGGDIDKGAEVMENMMKNLEAGGEVSEESQGMQGARDMFQTAQTLEGIM